MTTSGGMAPRLVLASGNAGKLKELRALLAPLGLSVVAQSKLGIPDAPEPHESFVENALAKARHASRLSGSPALADDSGLCVRALGGAPGVRSARYATTDEHGPRSDEANNARLVADLAGVVDRRACFVSVLVFVRSAADPMPLIAQGRWDGEIVDQPRGSGGFGYDPHFFLPALGETAAEISADLKNRLSHRAQAMQSLLASLRLALD
jgi:XTP/dITP diphosphohydrolase